MNILIQLVRYGASHAVAVIFAGIVLGAAYGLASSLMIHTSYFNYDPIVDCSMYGAFFGLLAWLSLKFAASNLPEADGDSVQRKTLRQIIFPKFLNGPSGNPKSAYSKLVLQRNMLIAGIGLLGLTTLIQAIGSPKPGSAVLGGAVIGGFLALGLVVNALKRRNIRSESPGESENNDGPAKDE